MGVVGGGDWRWPMRWLIFALFLIGMISSLGWHEAGTSGRKTVFGFLALGNFALVLVLGMLMT